MCLLLSTCVRSGKGAEDAGVLRRPVVHLHDVVQRRLEEGELTEDHWKRQEIDIRGKTEIGECITVTL